MPSHSPIRPITVTLVEAWAERVSVRELRLPEGATLHDALTAAGLVTEAAMNEGSVGVWGKQVPADTRLVNGDRIERYRPITADPKAARHQRATDQGYRWQGRTRRAARSASTT
jgi:uncharacterized protein